MTSIHSPSTIQAIPGTTLQIGHTQITPVIKDGYLVSLGAPQIAGTALRDETKRWIPWFDAYDGGVWNRFRFEGVEQRGETQVLRTTAFCDNDYPFRERRDSSGDICLRNQHWDTPPLEAKFDICFRPMEHEIEGRFFTGFKYWFEYTGETGIHRLLDRQTWELGGNLGDVTLCLRNWLTQPRVKLGVDTEYSTVGLNEWARLLPGNLWARWSLLPSFDFQYGGNGVLVGWFDEVSLIRTVVESGAGEDCLRVLDLHLFAQTTHYTSNAKTVLHCPDVLDDEEALNLWTRVYDAESEKARSQYRLPPEEAPAILFSHNAWTGIRLNETYEATLDIASEYNGDYVFIDPVWENLQAWRESLEEALPVEKQKGAIFDKWSHGNMCCTLDFEVAEIHGGEAGLKALCDRAAARDLKIMSWMATHLTPNSMLMTEENLAVKESGRHPDTGYADACWPIKAGSEGWRRMREQLLGVCERTGLSGYLWDSFSNLAWWHLDYADGGLAPQLPLVMDLYRDLEEAGLYIMPEAIVSFSGHSCCGLHGGDTFEGDLLGFSYNSNTELPKGVQEAMVRGEVSVDLLFQCIAHKRVPNMHFHFIDRAEWDPANMARIAEILGTYKAQRHLMQKRTVLKDNAGVLWESAGGADLLYSFVEQPATGPAVDCMTGAVVEGNLQPNHVYRFEAVAGLSVA